MPSGWCMSTRMEFFFHQWPPLLRRSYNLELMSTCILARMTAIRRNCDNPVAHLWWKSFSLYCNASYAHSVTVPYCKKSQGNESGQRLGCLRGPHLPVLLLGKMSGYARSRDYAIGTGLANRGIVVEFAAGTTHFSSPKFPPNRQFNENMGCFPGSKTVGGREAVHWPCCSAEA